MADQLEAGPTRTGPTFKEVVLQKQEKLKLTDPKILTVARQSCASVAGR